MKKASIGLVLGNLTLFAAISGSPVAGQGPDPGVTFTRLIDRTEIRISRVVLQPGASRSAHAHDDVEYHAWVPLEGSLELSLSTDLPVAAVPGEAFFLERGTMHGFRNVGSTEAAVMEVFVKNNSEANAFRNRHEGGAHRVQLAALIETLLLTPASP